MTDIPIRQWRRSVENIGGQKAWAGRERKRKGGGMWWPPLGTGAKGSTPGKRLVKTQNPAFWFALGKKMCSCLGLLRVRDIDSLDPHL